MTKTGRSRLGISYFGNSPMSKGILTRLIASREIPISPVARRRLTIHVQDLFCVLTPSPTIRSKLSKKYNATRTRYTVSEYWASSPSPISYPTVTDLDILRIICRFYHIVCISIHLWCPRALDELLITISSIPSAHVARIVARIVALKSLGARRPLPRDSHMHSACSISWSQSFPIKFLLLHCVE